MQVLESLRADIIVCISTLKSCGQSTLLYNKTRKPCEPHPQTYNLEYLGMVIMVKLI